MTLENGANISNEAILTNLKKLTNQTYKLLPNREENLDWQTPLTTIIEEFCGMDDLLAQYHDILFPLLCKLQGLFSLIKEDDFFLYRRTIFECLNIISVLKKEISECQEEIL